jgi:predicted enzyme related to lactoylglutathione lyase
MDFRLQLVVVPVSDVDRTKAFYEQLGWGVDHDHRVSDESSSKWTDGAASAPPPEVRFVQVTPPGSACSIAFGAGLTDAAPGSVDGLQVVVDDVEAAKAELEGRGLEVRGIEDYPWGRFAWFTDPDGNGWAVQELPDYGG